MPKRDIVGVHVDIIGKDGLLAAIAETIRQGRKSVFAYANIHAINLAHEDTRFREFLNRATVLYCDGEGVRLGARMLGVKLPPRIVLTYWIWELCAFCETHGFTVFFLGGTNDALENAVHNIRARHPMLKIVGSHQGYFEKIGEESEKVIDVISRVKPNVLLVSLGMPLQELWIEENCEKLFANAILPSGSMIDYTAGKKRLTPPWMANHGLEWLYRLIQEPGRLWRRYVFGNPLFMARIVRQLLVSGRQA
jgi:N-acetylglucosaminyldiphosphoundecaprenol N-acetyl-beta-D-mannosaminyltransferase